MHQPRLEVAYLTAEYPKVSHTFIRREIIELERLGHKIFRVAVRSAGNAIADASDELEAGLTTHILELPKGKIVSAALWTLLSRPLGFASALLTTLRMSRSSERGILRHLGYLIEAAVLLQLLRARNIKHVHVHFGMNAAAVARLAHHIGGVTYSMTVHGSAEFDSPLGFSLCEKVEDAEFVVAISDYCRAQIMRWAPPESWPKIHIVRCSVADEYFEESYPPDEKSRTLVSIGRICAEKGYLLLLEAIRQLINSGTEVKLVIVGDGELRPMLESLIKKYELTDHVRITGWRDDAAIRDEIRNSRVMVQPSFAEGLPVVIMESFAMGRPVISTHVGGIPELVKHGENGWLIPAGDINELVSALQEALDTPAETLATMAQAGQALVKSRHHVKTETAILEELLVAASLPSDGD